MAVEGLKWLYEQAIESIKDMDEGYVRQGTANALIGAIQELNKLEDLYPSQKIEQTNRNIEITLGGDDFDDN